jgi:undecaprenyl-diphosphatase
LYTFNLGLFRAINGWPDGWSPFWRFFSEAFNMPAVKICLLVLLIAMVTRGYRARPTALKAVLAVAIANPLTDLWKHLAPMHRPFQELSGVIMRAGATQHLGTASAHAANTGAVATVFVLCLGWWGLPAAAVAVLTGISRVYVGVHYPSQVLLGWACGIFAGLIVTKTWDWIARVRKTVKSDEDEPQTEGK